MQGSILYYPHIEFQNLGWVKSSLLLWDHVYRIVPDFYEPNDTLEIRKAVDSDIVRSISLTEQDRKKVVDKFAEFLDSIPYKPAGLEYDETEYLHPGKIDTALYPLLDQYAVGVSPKGFIELPKEVVRGYMFFLANDVASRRNLSRCTDDIYSFSVSPYFSENTNIDDLIYSRDAEGFYSSLIFNDLLPANIESIPIEKILKVINNSKDERIRFRNELSKFTSELYKCTDKTHAEVIMNDYKKELLQAKDDLKASQGFMNKDDIGSMLTMGIPTSLTAYGAIAGATQNPFNLYTIGSSLLIGAMTTVRLNQFKKMMLVQHILSHWTSSLLGRATILFFIDTLRNS